MTNKMTNRKALQFVLDNCTVPADVSEKIKAMIASLDHKAASGTRKPTARQTENASLKDKILDFLTENPGPFTCTEIGKGVPELNGEQNQRISALCNQLTKEGALTKDKLKGKTVFSAANVVVEIEEEG